MAVLLNAHSQLQTDTANLVYVGKMIYTQKGNVATYKIRFPIDFQADFELDKENDQVFYPFLYKKGAFHYSQLKDTTRHTYNEIYLFKQDSFYNAIHYFSRDELETMSFGDPCHHCMHEAVTYKKGQWYTFTMECNMNIWSKFKGYRLAFIYDGYVFEGRRNKIIFLSKPLK